MNGAGPPRQAAASGVNVALGIWLIISPFVLVFTHHESAKWNDIACGIAVALVALRGWSVWNVALGIWLIISAFVLGFANVPTLLWNNVILGALVGIVAFSSSTRQASEGAGPPPA
ncbi:MAG TPA: SPW repeat protein [Candidatus Acidoferrum sp.]|nr:SPW repeat protein [Candidatus Acidoferrum sp.]